MLTIENEPRNYPWGSVSEIARLRGRPESGQPEAELWFGDHAVSPAVIVNTGETLRHWGQRHPERLGGEQLPFLVKILAASAPLSIQAHPTIDQARRGFARENAAGIALDASHRNYRDNHHKPEIIIALTSFSALCGFRPADSRNRITRHLLDSGIDGASELARRSDNLADAVSWLLGRGDGVAELVAGVSSGTVPPSGLDDVDDAMAVARDLARHYPGDPGIVVSLLLNHRVLKPGDALYLPAGNMHAYLHGLGVEVMAASDNVLRGGLTSKHIDVPELLSVVDFTELDEPALVPDVDGPIRRFDPGITDFAVLDVRVDGLTPVTVAGPAIGVVVEGAVTFGASDGPIPAGRAVFVEAGETLTMLDGRGHVFVAIVPQT